MKNPMTNYIVRKFIGVVILVVCVAVAAVYAVANVAYDMGVDSGINKILNEQEIANQTAHTEWANFGGGYYIIGAEAIAVEDGTTTFEFISGTQVVSKLGEFSLDSVYMLTVYDNGTPDWMDDDIIVVVWEAK